MIDSLAALATSLSQSGEVWLLVKISCAAAVGLMAAALARRARAAVRHAILAATVVGVLALPAATALLPPLSIPLPAAPRTAASAPGANTTTGQPARAASAAAVDAPDSADASRLSISPVIVARSIWVFGTLALLAALAVQIWRLRQMRSGGVPWIEGHGLVASLRSGARITRDVDVLLHEDAAAPLTCGITRPVIVLPADAADWPEPAIRRALVHELEHVRRQDWLLHVLARAACAIYWFHPFVWMASRRLALEAERACDDAVLVRAAGTDYAQQLVTLARRMSASAAAPALGMAYRSDLSARISAVLDDRQPRGRAGWARATSIATLALTAIVLIAPLRAVREPLSTETERSGSEQSPERSAGVTRVSRIDRALVEAAQDGDIDDVTRLLNSGANVNAAVEGDGSPLIAAAREGHLETVTFLLDRGADVNLGVRGDGNPLIMAAREGHMQIVQLLLDRGADVNQIVPDDENALIQASGEGRLEIVRLLVSRGADVNARVWVEPAFERPGGEWRTALGMARRGNHRAVVEFLISQGARE